MRIRPELATQLTQLDQPQQHNNDTNNENSNDDTGNNSEPASQEEQKSQFDLSRRINDHGRRNNKFRDKTNKIVNHVCVRVQCICEIDVAMPAT